MARHYILANGDARHKENPKTFYMPPLKERKAVEVGHSVKLIFEPIGGGNSERMWVKITKVDAYSGFKGSLENDPLIINAKYGDTVTFNTEHIVDILKDEATQ